MEAAIRVIITGQVNENQNAFGIMRLSGAPRYAKDQILSILSKKDRKKNPVHAAVRAVDADASYNVRASQSDFNKNEGDFTYTGRFIITIAKPIPNMTAQDLQNQLQQQVENIRDVLVKNIKAFNDEEMFENVAIDVEVIAGRNIGAAAAGGGGGAAAAGGGGNNNNARAFLRAEAAAGGINNNNVAAFLRMRAANAEGAAEAAAELADVRGLVAQSRANARAAAAGGGGGNTNNNNNPLRGYNFRAEWNAEMAAIEAAGGGGAGGGGAVDIGPDPAPGIQYPNNDQRTERVLPANATNVLTTNSIAPGTHMVNFHNENREHRYYTQNTFNALNTYQGAENAANRGFKRNPFTRRRIEPGNITRYIARVGTQGGGRRHRRHRRHTTRRRRSTMKKN